jgi:Secretion system C-terminal sorting domain
MKTLIILLFIFLVPTIFAQHNSNPLTYNDFDTLDINNIQLVSSNLGNCDPSRWISLPDPGYGNGIIYEHGPWLVGKINGDSVLSIIQWFKGWNYSPGPIIDGQAAMLIHPEDSLKYRVYKISKGDDETNPDYAEWPVEFGAPINQNGNPLVLGDQTLWTAFNSFDSSVISLPVSWRGTLCTVPLEFHQTVFARQGNSNDERDIFSNTVFIELEIINKGNYPIDSAYFGFWSDIDFANSFDGNLPAVDTVGQIGYCWDPIETHQGEVPPAVGYALLYGPVVPSPGNNATFRGRLLPNYKNLKLNSFHGIADDSFYIDSLHSPVRSVAESQNVARGLLSNGYPIVDPISNLPTTFPYSGDPVVGEGWIYDFWTSGGAGFVFFSGPFTLAPSDTQWAMIAIVPGLGSSNLNSIAQMRQKVEILRSLPYDSLALGTLSYPITDVEDESENNTLPEEFSLNQNYPNPFNPTTMIKFTIPYVGAYRNTPVQLKVYDILGNEITTLVNEEKSPGVYEVEFDATGLPSGIYFYQLHAGSFVQTKKMILLK